MSAITNLQTEPAAEERASTRGARPLAESDLPGVLELHQRVFGTAPSAEFLKRIFFEPPWREERLPSLVYENEEGRLVASLGVMPRRMRFRSLDVQAAVGHHFVVEPTRRGTQAG